MGMRSDYLRDTGRYEPEHEKKSGISNLNIYKKTVKIIALGGILAVAATNPHVQKAVVATFDTIVDYDNKKFEQEGEYYRDQVIELTGSTPEEIMERGRAK